MRFLHIADIHLDTSFAGRSESVRRRLREASRESFRRAVELALRERVHAVLIAGDLFDGDRLSFQTERFLLEQTGRLAQEGITVVYATGNHDPGGPEAGPRTLSWPAGVHVAGDEVPIRVEVQDRQGRTVGRVSAIGHRTRRERDDLSRLLPRPDGSVPEVAVLHTQVRASPGAEAHHAYAPSELGRLERAGFDYWALGHIHTRQILSRDPPVVYAGSLQGKTHAETGPRGATLVDLSDRSAPALRFVPLAAVRWETLRLTDLAEADSLDTLLYRVRAAWKGRREEGDAPADRPSRREVSAGAGGEEAPARSSPGWMVRVRLEGPSPLWRELRREEDRELLARELTGHLDALEVTVVTDRIHPVVPVEEHRERVDVLGASLRALEAVRRGDATLSSLDPAELAGLPDPDPEAVARYVRRLLEGSEGELAARFLGADES